MSQVRRLVEDVPGESYTTEGTRFSQEVEKVLRPVLEEWSQKGVSHIDMEMIARGVVELDMIFLRVNAGIEYRKQQLAEKEMTG